MRGVLDAVDARARMGAWIRRGAGSHPRLLVAAAMFSLVVGIALRETLTANRSPSRPLRMRTRLQPAAWRRSRPPCAGPFRRPWGRTTPATSRPRRPPAWLAARTPSQNLSSSFGPAGVTVRSPARGCLSGCAASATAAPSRPSPPRLRVRRPTASSTRTPVSASGTPTAPSASSRASPSPGPRRRQGGAADAELSLSGSAPAVAGPGGKSFTVGSLDYTGLTAVDARGRLLPSHLRVAGGRLLLTVTPPAPPTR